MRVEEREKNEPGTRCQEFLLRENRLDSKQKAES
jgi:hypothetical protein